MKKSNGLAGWRQPRLHDRAVSSCARTSSRCTLFFFFRFPDKTRDSTTTRLFGWIRAEEVKAQWSALVRGITYVGNSTDTHIPLHRTRVLVKGHHTPTHNSLRTANEQRTARAATMNIYWPSCVSSTHDIAG